MLWLDYIIIILKIYCTCSLTKWVNGLWGYVVFIKRNIAWKVNCMLSARLIRSRISMETFIHKSFRNSTWCNSDKFSVTNAVGGVMMEAIQEQSSYTLPLQYCDSSPFLLYEEHTSAPHRFLDWFKCNSPDTKRFFITPLINRITFFRATTLRIQPPDFCFIVLATIKTFACMEHKTLSIKCWSIMAECILRQLNHFTVHCNSSREN